MTSLLGVVAVLLAAILVVAGGTAVVTTKGGVAHRTAGRVFAGVSVPTGVVLALLGAATADLFLGTIASLLAYGAWSGRREVVRHRQGAAPGVADLAPVALLALVPVGLATWAWVRRADPTATGITAVVLGFAALVAGLVAWELHRLLRPPDRAHAWLQQHVSALGMAYVAVWTLVGAVLLRPWGVPSGIAWVGPAVVGTPVLVRWISRVQRDGRDARFL